MGDQPTPAKSSRHSEQESGEFATDTSRSHGFIHRVLTDEGAALRGRGGATRAKAKQNGTAAKKSEKARKSK